MTITKEQIVASIKKCPIGFGCGALSLALVVAIYFRAGPISEAGDEMEKKSAEAQRLALNLKNAVQLTEQFNTLSTATRQIESRLMRPGDLAKNQQYFYRLETETNTKLIDCRQGSISEKEKNSRKTLYPAVPYIVAVQGDYAQIMTFLRHIESGMHYCRITSASITPSTRASTPGESSEGLLTLNLNLEFLGQP